MTVLIKRSAENRGKAVLDGRQPRIPSLSLAFTSVRTRCSTRATDIPFPEAGDMSSAQCHGLSSVL